MIDWYKKVVLENYANFKGRARRSEYWYFVLGSLILGIITTTLDNLLGLNFAPLPYGWFYAAYGLAVFVPSLAVLVRRLHDVGKSGWFFFIILIPIIGSIWLLVLLCTDGEKNTNQYGPDPKNTLESINEIGNKEA